MLSFLKSPARGRGVRRGMGLGVRSGVFATVAASVTLSTIVHGPVAQATDAITLTASPATVAPESAVDLTASMPVVGAGTVSQEIEQQIDPAKVQLTGFTGTAIITVRAKDTAGVKARATLRVLVKPKPARRPNMPSSILAGRSLLLSKDWALSEPPPMSAVSIRVPNETPARVRSTS